MAEYQKIEYRIGKDGSVKEQVMGATGSSCTSTTASIEESLGVIEAQELLPEYYDGDEVLNVDTTQSHQAK